MIYYYDELLLKYKNYKNPKDKIQREINEGKYFRLKKGLYEDNIKVDGYLLAGLIEAYSYLSFEYALSKYGLIPERTYVYTSATTLTKHNKKVENVFGLYTYTDIPLSVWDKEVKIITEGDYTYMISTPEKALCDLLYKKEPVYSIKQLKELMFEDLRIDEDEFYCLDKEKIIKLCDHYGKRNLKILKKMLIGEINNEQNT